MDGEGLFKIPEMGKKKTSRRLSIQSIDIPINFIKKKRKRQDEDSISIASVDSFEGNISLNTSRTSTKSKRRSILQTSSLINILSPNRAFKSQSNSSFKLLDGSNPSTPKLGTYKPPGPTPTKRRATSTWTDTMAGRKHVPQLSQQFIILQEAIYELYQGEKDIAADLINVKKMYRESMLTLSLFTPEEADQIFGPLDRIIPVHEDLARRLEERRQRDGTTQGVGQQILDWVPQLSVYVSFCGNQLSAKSLLDSKRMVPAVRDYLARCQDVPHSRKLDLWALLDGARGRFVKYPLLIKAIMKETPEDHADIALLQKALSQLDVIIRQADDTTGKTECQFHKSQLRYIFDEQKIPEIEESNALICQGTLKNNKGSKVQLYLFDKAAVVTRHSNQGQQVYRQPVPLSQLVVEDLADGEVKMGSFRNAFGQGQTSKNVFRISFMDPAQGQSHTLMATDEHAKQQWMRSFQSLTSHILHKGSSTCDKK